LRWVIVILLLQPKMPVIQTDVSLGKNKLYLSNSKINLKVFSDFLFIRKMGTVIDGVYHN